MTISISSAPSPRAKAVSATFTSVKVCEVGKPPDTAAIFTEDTSRLARTVPAKLGYTQIAATLGISGCSSSKSFTRLVNLVIESVLSSVCNEVRSIQLNKTDIHREYCSLPNYPARSFLRPLPLVHRLNRFYTDSTFLRIYPFLLI